MGLCQHTPPTILLWHGAMHRHSFRFHNTTTWDPRLDKYPSVGHPYPVTDILFVVDAGGVTVWNVLGHLAVSISNLAHTTTNGPRTRKATIIVRLHAFSSQVSVVHTAGGCVFESRVLFSSCGTAEWQITKKRADATKTTATYLITSASSEMPV